jgi:hypothetical protein
VNRLRKVEGARSATAELATNTKLPPLPPTKLFLLQHLNTSTSSTSQPSQAINNFIAILLLLLQSSTSCLNLPSRRPTRMSSTLYFTRLHLPRKSKSKDCYNIIKFFMSGKGKYFYLFDICLIMKHLCKFPDFLPFVPDGTIVIPLSSATLVFCFT